MKCIVTTIEGSEYFDNCTGIERENHPKNIGEKVTVIYHGKHDKRSLFKPFNSDEIFKIELFTRS